MLVLYLWNVRILKASASFLSIISFLTELISWKKTYFQKVIKKLFFITTVKSYLFVLALLHGDWHGHLHVALGGLCSGLVETDLRHHIVGLIFLSNGFEATTQPEFGSTLCTLFQRTSNAMPISSHQTDKSEPTASFFLHTTSLYP